MTIHRAAIAALTCLAGSLGACYSATTPRAPQASLVAVTPRGGTTGVNPTVSIAMRFDHAMSPLMPMYAALHAGDVTGPLVTCTASWSSDLMTLTLTPATSLTSATMYTLHVGGMKDAGGNVIDMRQYGPMMGGQWATGSMMTGGGMMGGGNEMGPGWQGSNGMYGMIFSFTTS